MNDLSSATAVVTGASRGIGRAIARALSAEGAQLLLVSRGGTDLEAMAAETGGSIVAADLAGEEGVPTVVAAAGEQFGGAPDILINNAGVFRLAPAVTVEPAEFDLHLDLNLRAPFRLTRAFLPEMVARGSGSLVHLGSVAGRQPFPENAAYAASKYGLRGLHDVLCLELAGSGVRSLLVDPGPVDTGAWDRLEDRLGVDLPARDTMLRPETVAEAVVDALRLSGEGARSDILVLPA